MRWLPSCSVSIGTGPKELTRKTGAYESPTRTEPDWVKPFAFAAIGYLVILQAHILLLAVPTYSMHGPNDFVALYSAGLMFDSGARQSIYDLRAQDTFRVKSMPPGQEIHDASDIAFYHAPYEVLPFAALARLSYRSAFFVWAALNLGLLMVGTWAIGLNPMIALAFIRSRSHCIKVRTRFYFSQS